MIYPRPFIHNVKGSLMSSYTTIILNYNFLLLAGIPISPLFLFLSDIRKRSCLRCSSWLKESNSFNKQMFLSAASLTTGRQETNCLNSLWGLMRFHVMNKFYLLGGSCSHLIFCMSAT